MPNPLMFVLGLLTSPLASEHLVQRLLRSQLFHRGVRRVHRTVETYKNGRDPGEPLRPGEATFEPGRTSAFFRHFSEELRNQFRGTPTQDASAAKKTWTKR